MSINNGKPQAYIDYEEKFGKPKEKAYNEETFNSDLRGIYKDHLKFSAFRSGRYLDSEDFQKLPQENKDLLLAEYYDVKSSNTKVRVPLHDKTPQELLSMSDEDRAAHMAHSTEVDRGVSDSSLDLMFRDYIDVNPEHRDKSDEELSRVKAEYLKGYVYSNDEKAREKINNIVATPDIENLIATAKLRDPKRGNKLYEKFTNLRQAGALRTPAGQALIKEANAIGASLPEDKKFEATDDAKRRVLQGGVRTNKEGGIGVAGEVAAYDFLSEVSGTTGQFVREYNTNSQRENFVEALQNVDLEGLISAEFNRSAEMAEMPTTYVNKNEKWWDSLKQQMTGMKEMATGLVSGDNKSQAWNDLARGMFEDKNGVLGFVAGYGAANAFARVAKLSRYSKAAAAAKLRGKAIPSKSLLAKMGGYAGESVTSAVGGSIPVALDEAEFATKMQAGMKNFAFVNTMIQDAVMGYPMDLAVTGIKKITLDPAAKVTKKAYKGHKKKRADKKFDKVLSAYQDPAFEGLLEATAGIDVQSNGRVVKINFDETPKITTRKSIAKITKKFLKSAEPLEKNDALKNAKLHRLDKAYNALGEDLSDYQKKLYIFQEQAVTKAHYDGLGSAFDPENLLEDTYLTGIATEVEVDGQRQYIYENQGIYDIVPDYVPTRNITTVRTDLLKESIDKFAKTKDADPIGVFENFLFEEDVYLARTKFYENQSMNPAAFENSLIFSTKVKTQQRRPLNLTGIVRKEGLTLGYEIRADQARARALEATGIDIKEIKEILPKFEGDIHSLPVLPLMNMVVNRGRRYTQLAKTVQGDAGLKNFPLEKFNVLSTDLLGDAQKISKMFSKLESETNLNTATKLRAEIDGLTSTLVSKINQFDYSVDAHTDAMLGDTDFATYRAQNTEKLLAEESIDGDASDLDGIVEASQEYGFTDLEANDDLGLVLSHPGDKGGATIVEQANMNKQTIDAEAQTKSEPKVDEDGNVVDEPIVDTEESHKTVEKEEAANLAKEQAKESMAEDVANVENSPDYDTAEKLNTQLKAEHNPEQATPKLIQEEAADEIAKAKSEIPKGSDIEVKVGDRVLKISHYESGALAVTSLDSDGMPTKEFIFQDDGKLLYEDGTKKAANGKLLRGLISRKNLSEAGVAKSFGLSHKVLIDQPMFSAELQSIAAEYRERMFELVDDIRMGKFSDAKQIENAYRDLLVLKKDMFDKVDRFSTDYGIPTQKVATSAIGNRIKLLNQASELLNIYKKGVKQDKKTGKAVLESREARLAAFRQAQVKIQNALDTGSKNPNAADLGIRTKIAETSRKVEGYLENSNFAKADGLMNTLFTDFKQYSKGYISNGSEQASMFDNKEKSKQLIVNQRDLSAEEFTIENNPLSRLLIDRNMGLPNLLSTDRLISKIYGYLSKAKGGELHGNMTKITGLESLGGGIFWLDQDRPTYTMKGAQAKLFKTFGAERSLEGTEMVNLRYKIEGKSNYKAQGDYDTMYAQVAVPIAELAKMIQDPEYKPNYYADFSGTHKAPTTNEKNPHILNSVVELKKTSSDYAKTELALHEATEGSYLAKDLVNELFVREDGTFNFEAEFDVEVRESKNSKKKIKGKLKLMTLGEKKMPVFVEEQHLRGAVKEDGTRLEDRVVTYDYPIQGDIASVTFLDAVNVEKMKGVNNGMRAEAARLKYDSNVRKSIEVVEIVDTNESRAIPSESDVPVTNTFQQQLDGMESVRGAIEKGFSEMQKDNPDISMMFYGDAGNVMVPSTKNTWIRKGIGKAKDFLDRLPQGVKSSENGDANLKIVNLMSMNKEKDGFKGRGATKTILNDIKEGDVYVVAHKGTEVSDDLHEAFSKKGVTFSGRIGVAGEGSFSIYASGKPSGGTTAFSSTGEFKSALKSVLSGKTARTPIETLAKGEVSIDMNVNEVYMRSEDGYVNMNNNEEFTSLSSFQKAEAMIEQHKKDNPNEKLEYTIKVSKKSESQLIKSTMDPKELLPELTSSSRISINGKTLGLGELNPETLMGLAQQLEIPAESLEAFMNTLSDTKKKKKDIPDKDVKHQLALTIDKAGNINNVSVLENASVKFENSDNYKVSVGKQAVSQKRIVVDARVKETAPRPLDVPEEVYKAIGTNGNGTISKFKNTLKAMKTAYDFISTKVDGDDHPNVSAKSTAGVILKDQNLMTLVDDFFVKGDNDALLKVENYLGRLKEEAKSLPPESQAKLESGVKEIMSTLLDVVEPKGLDKKLMDFKKSMKENKNSKEKVMQDFITKSEDMLGNRDTESGFDMFKEEGVTNSQIALRDTFKKALFGSDKLVKRQEVFLGRLTTAYAHYAGKLSSGLLEAKVSEGVDAKLSKNDKMVIADAAMEMLKVNVLTPGSLDANMTTTNFLVGYAKGNHKLQSNLAFVGTKSLLGLVGLAAATSLAVALYPSDDLESEDDELLKEEDLQSSYFNMSNTVSITAALALGLHTFGKGPRKVKAPMNGSLVEGIRNFSNRGAAQRKAQEIMHNYQGSGYAGSLGTGTMSQWFASAPEGSLRSVIGRKLGHAENLSQMSVNQLSTVLDATMSKYKTEAEKAKYLELLEKVSKLTNEYGNSGLSVEDRIKNAYADLYEREPGVYSDEMLVNSSWVANYIEETRQYAYDAELLDNNQELRTNYVVSANTLDKEAIISEFHIGPGLGVDQLKMTNLLERGIYDAKARGYDFDEIGVASILLNDYGSAGGDSFNKVKERIVDVLKERDPKGASRSKDYYRNKLKLIPRTPAEIASILSSQTGKGTQTNPEGAKLEIYNSIENKSKEGFLKNFDRMAKQIYYGSGLELDNPTYLKEVIDDMPDTMVKEFFDNLRMDIGTNYLDRVKRGEITNPTDINNKDMADYSNNAALKNFQSFQAQSKLSWSNTQGFKEFASAAIQNGILYGFGNVTKELVKKIFTEVDYGTYVTIRNFQTAVHSSNADQGFNQGSRALMSRFAQNSRVPSYDLVSNLANGKYKERIDNIFGDFFNEEITVSNKMAVLLDLPEGTTVPRKYLHQGHSGYSMFYRAMNGAGAMVAYDLGKSHFDGVASRFKDKGTITDSEMSRLKAVLTDEEIASLATLDKNNKTEQILLDRMAMRYAIDGVQGVTGITSSSNKKLRASNKKYFRFITTFRQAPTNVFHYAWNHILMPALEGDTKPLARMVAGSAILGAYSMSKINQTFGLEETKDITQLERSAILQAMTYHLSHMASSIPADVALGIAGMIDDPNRQQNWRQALRQVGGSNPSTIVNTVFTAGAVFGHGVAAIFDEPGARLESTGNAIGKLAKSELKLVRELDAMQKYAFTDEAAYSSEKGGITGLLEEISRNIGNKRLPKFTSNSLIPEYPAYVNLSNVAFDKFRKHTIELQTKNKHTNVEMLDNLKSANDAIYKDDIKNEGDLKSRLLGEKSRDVKAQDRKIRMDAVMKESEEAFKKKRGGSSTKD